MENCLVSKLKGIVNNDNLEKFNVLKINVASASSRPSLSIYIRLTKAAEAVSSVGYFVNNNEEQIASPVTLPANTTRSILAPKNTAMTVEITEKYSIVFIDSGYSMKFDIGQLKYTTTLKSFKAISSFGEVDASNWSELTSFTLNSSTAIGNINTFSNCPLLQTLVMDVNSNYTGNVSNLAGLSALATLDIHETKISGDANIFADNTKFIGLSSLNLTNCANITNKTAEVKALIEAAHPGITVTW
jgi:hypothetical protein